MNSVGFATKGDGKMCIYHNKCNDYNKTPCNGINNMIGEEPTCFEKKPLTTDRAPVAKLQCSDGLSCAGCELSNSLLLSILNAAKNRLITTTNKEHDDILDEIETHLKGIGVI